MTVVRISISVSCFMLPYLQLSLLLKLNNVVYKAKMLHAKFLTVAHNLGNLSVEKGYLTCSLLWHPVGLSTWSLSLLCLQPLNCFVVASASVENIWHCFHFTKILFCLPGLSQEATCVDLPANKCFSPSVSGHIQSYFCSESPRKKCDEPTWNTES